MNRFFPVAVACVAGISACTNVREPTDAQLTTFLRNEHSPVARVNASLDSSAIDCLRAWSGDSDLMKGLAVRFAGEDGKKTCRTTLDGWIADSARNPDKFSFADMSAPKTVRHAIGLQGAKAVASIGEASAIPPALMKPQAPPAALRQPDPSLDLGVAGAKLQEAETLCLQAQQEAVAPGANKRLKSFSTFCSGNLSRLRTTLEQSARSGQTSAKLDELANSATNVANIARNLLATGKQP
ncbi:MAG: hypothetical protein ABIR62_13155 [Dokdonella sp.]|uniref:hypothetical protein n=1 Tax=Dokdonella sp. TaxID=2291710 RepID=UPI003266D9CA